MGMQNVHGMHVLYSPEIPPTGFEMLPTGSKQGYARGPHGTMHFFSNQLLKLLMNYFDNKYVCVMCVLVCVRVYQCKCVCVCVERAASPLAPAEAWSVYI